MAASKLPMNKFLVQAQDVSKKYGKITALSGISFGVPEGELFGLIGPDGAGKTTLFRILATLLVPETGTASVCGLDVVKDYRAIRNLVGYMPGKFSLYQDLTVEENLAFFATVFNTTIKENYHLIRDIYVQIEPFKKRRAGALSGGMKQKLALSCALIHKPRVLFLDEPTTGVDPVSRKEFWEMLDHLKKEGITIIVSTPYMDEAEKCDRIALVHGGSFLTTDTPGNIVDRFSRPLFAVRGDSMYAILKDLRLHPELYSCFPFGDTHHASFVNPDMTIPVLSAWLEGKGHTGLEISPIRAGIEDCFMDLSPEGNRA
jgi:ABC-type multidrug transport system ATPase subunit